jgi:hypothetical protein
MKPQLFTQEWKFHRGDIANGYGHEIDFFFCEYSGDITMETAIMLT